jgi:hypothetical protein
MRDDLIDYFLKLDDAVAAPTSDGDRSALERVRLFLTPLEADRDPIQPPPMLSARTLGFVAEHLCLQGQRHVIDPPQTSSRPITPTTILPSDRAIDPPSSRWRWPNVVVAVAIGVVSFALVTSLLPRIRNSRDVTLCTNQMRLLYQAFANYCDQHDGSFPMIDERPPHNQARAFSVILNEQGLLPSSVRASCPASDPGQGGYAYVLGYRGGDGRLFGLRRSPDEAQNDLMPLMADRPSRVAGPDHYSGQNVLFTGGFVRFCTHPRVGVSGDDIYLNQAGRVAAGLHQWDTAMGVGADQP